MEITPGIPFSATLNQPKNNFSTRERALMIMSGVGFLILLHVGLHRYIGLITSQMQCKLPLTHLLQQLQNIVFVLTTSSCGNCIP